MNTLLTVLFGVYVLLQVLDYVTTMLCVKSGHGHEANPLTKALMDKFGVTTAMIIQKLIAIAIGLGLTLFVNYIGYSTTNALFIVLDGIYIYVVYKNYKIAKP